ncbi:hypothetical protein [Sphingomonas sp. Leaf67]|uniref:hypothetical protein n=1 Tax=Sphingomonas sp. Leaf67 TaxID=1736230 RepID=UPI0012E2F801|nr:hypothetical protein [Sphingomonas sp. Leaf67]
MTKPSASVPGENAFQGYWRVFGGTWQILRSTYFWISGILTLTLPKVWQTKDGSERVWTGITLDVTPSLLGFALGGMAIMLAFSSGKFLEAIRQKGKDNSYLRKIMASFFHFCVVLTASILTAYISRFYDNDYLSAVGVFLSYYGILLVLATASRIWHTARIFNAVSDAEKP